MCSRRLILATIVMLTLIIVPAVARALEVTVTVTVDGTSSTTSRDDFSFGCVDPPAPPGTDNTGVEGPPACVDISGNYPSDANPLVAIDPGAQVVALRGDTVNQLVVQGTNITNIAASEATVTITYQHPFFGVNTSVTRFYGLSISGNFFRPPFSLAKGDRVEMNGSVSYSLSCRVECTAIPIISGTPNPSYTVPSVGSFSFNNFGPDTPTQVTGGITCGDCGTGERLQSEVMMTLAPGDSNSLVGSAHTASATTEDALNSVFGALTAKIAVHLPAEPSEGLIKVTLFGSPTFDVQPCGDTSCVDYSRVMFGPGMAQAVKNLQFHDANHDGITDVVLSFNNADANIACGDRVATLSGAGTFGGTEQPFSASSVVRTRPCP